jgi:aqualysin 1
MYMRTLIAFLSIFVIAAVVYVPSPQGGQQKGSKARKYRRAKRPVPNQHIVVFKDGVAGVPGEFSIASDLASDMTSCHGHKIKNVFKHALNGFTVQMTEDEAIRLAEEDDRIAWIEQDGEFTAAETQTNVAWGLDRIDQHAGLDGTFTYSSTGKGINVYILDTGIRTTHEDYKGRATFAFDAVNDGNTNGDCSGHGTHVAGILGGKKHGVAKNVKMHGVRILDCKGKGVASSVIAGVEWVTKNHVKPAIANMSLTGSGSASVDKAVKNSIAAGVIYIVAAGNSNVDACNTSPARVPEVITVGATNKNDIKAEFSNYGSCVDIFAPGEAILSTWAAGDTATRVSNGTSMAAPHVAGVAAMYLESNPTATQSAVADVVLGSAIQDKLHELGAGSPNLMLYSVLSDGAPCSGCTKYGGTLSAEGEVRYHPDEVIYVSSQGQLKGWLRGPSGSDFDLNLWFYNDPVWELVETSNNSNSTEEINFLARPGFYTWQVTSFKGKGSYNLWLQNP